MPSPPLILLPPSEGKATGGTGPPWAPATMTAPGLDDRRAAVMVALVRAMKGSAATRGKLLGVKGDALAAASEADRAVASGPTRPAIDRYTGVLYDALDYRSRPAAHRRRIDRQVRILSGLWGVVAPGDPIPEYKLKMGASLRPMGKLSTWWRPAVTEALAAEGAGRTIWDLLPNEHAAAWSPDLTARAPASIVSVRFLDAVRRGGRTELVVVSHWNKLLKGALVGHVVAEQLSDVAGLAELHHPLGYRFEPDLTEVSADGVRVTAAMVKR